MFMEGLLILPAVLGLILVLVGRWTLMVASRQFGAGWFLALRIVPLAEFVFAMRYWEYAKKGALTSCIGLLLMLPLGTKLFIESQGEQDDYVVQTDANGDEVQQERQSRIAHQEAIKRERLNRIMNKEIKVEELQARLAVWYQTLQQERSGLEKKPQTEIQAYNREAAAYQSLLAVSREEAGELDVLKKIPVKK